MKWMLVLYFWSSMHAVDQKAERTLIEPFPTKTECVTHQHLVSNVIVAKFPKAATASMCMTEADYRARTPVDQMQGMASYSRNVR